MDNIIVKITAESDMSDAQKDLEVFKQKESEILTAMEAVRKKQLEFINDTKQLKTANAEYKKLEKDLKTTQTTMSGFAASQKKVNDSVVAGTIAAPKLRTQIMELKDQLAKMEMAGDNSSKAFINLSVKAGKLQDQMGDTRQTVTILSSDTRALDTAMGLGKGLAGSFTVAASAAALLGGENEELQKAFFKVQAVMSILNGVNEVALMLNKNSVVVVNLQTFASESNTLSKIKNFAATTTQSAATAVQTGLESKSVIVKGASTVAQWALNTAVLAFPAVAIIAAITAIVGGFYLFASSANDAEREQAKLNNTIQQFNANQTETEKTQKHIIDLMKAKGASTDEIRKKEKEFANENAKNATNEYNRILKNKNATKEQVKAASDAMIEANSAKLEISRKYQIEDLQAVTDGNTKKSEEQKKADEKTNQSKENHKKYLLGIDKQLNDSKIDIMSDGWEKQEAQINKEFNEKIALITGNSAKELELIKNLELQKMRKINALTSIEAIKLEKMTGDGVIKIFEKAQDKKSDILINAENKLSEIVSKGNENSREKGLKEIQDIKDKEELKKQLLTSSVQFTQDIGNLLFDAKQEQLSVEMSDLDMEYQKKIELAEGNKTLQIKLETELAAKKLEIKIKQAKLDKEQAMFNIAISTAQAVMAALAIVPMTPASIALAVFAGVTGAAQLAAVASKPIPKYAKGKKSQGEGHFAQVGELGPETMWIPDNAAIIPHGRKMNFDTFREFGIPFDMDSKRMENIDYNRLGKAVADNVKIPTPKPVTVHVDKSGVNVDYGSGSTTYLNKKYSAQWN